MKNIEVTCMFVEEGLKTIDVIAELLNTVESGSNSFCGVVKLENIIDYGFAEFFDEEMVDYIIFGDVKSLSTEEKKKVKEVVLKELKNEENEGPYTDVVVDGVKYSIMWVRTVTAEENGVGY